MKMQTQDIPTNLKEAVLQDLLNHDYWVRALVETFDFIDLHYHPIAQGTVKDSYNNYSTWTVYVTQVNIPLNRVVKIKHKYFNLVI